MKKRLLSFIKKSSARSLFFIAVIVLGTILFASYYGIDRYFRIHDIQVHMNNKWVYDSLGNPSITGISNFENVNSLFLSTKDVEQMLYDSNPIIKKVQVEKELPSKLIMNLSFYQPAAVFEVSQGYYVLSSDGRILAKEKSRRQDLTFIKYYQKLGYDSANSGDILSYADLETALYFLSKITDLGFHINNIDINGPDMIALYADKKKFVVTTEKESELQLYQLTVLIKQFKIEGKEFVSIDLRYEKPIIQVK